MSDSVLPTPEEIRARVSAYPYWYHRIPLPGGVVTPGFAPGAVEPYRIPADLTGKRVLDVGAWDGFWTFEALRRGAREVVAIDDFSDHLGTLAASDRHGWETFDLCRELLGYGDDRCKRLEMNVYDVSKAALGRFDVIFLFGTLYHLRYPLLALDKLAAICDESIHLESAVADHYSAYRGKGRGFRGDVVMEFYPGSEYANNPTNWWAPTLLCMMAMLKAAGFAEVDGWLLTDQPPPKLSMCRGFARGRRRGRQAK